MDVDWSSSHSAWWGCEVCATSFALPFMASAVWMSSVTAPATRLEHAASCCFSSAVGFCRTYSIHTDTSVHILNKTRAHRKKTEAKFIWVCAQIKNKAVVSPCRTRIFSLLKGSTWSKWYFMYFVYFLRSVRLTVDSTNWMWLTVKPTLSSNLKPQIM